MRLRRPAAAWALAGLAVVLAGAMTPLSLMARQNPLVTGSAADTLVAQQALEPAHVSVWINERR